MTRLNRHDAHLLMAGIRVLTHLKGMAPTPDALADLLELPATLVRLQLGALSELGAVALVDSAYETHAEVRDYPRIEELEEGEGPAISEDLRAFDERKRAENEKMAHLFDSGESERQRQQKHDRMGDELRGFRKNKPKNPFGED